MYLAAIVALCFSQVGASQEPGEGEILPPQKFYSQVIPRPTGQNGYEEYVRAAEATGGSEVEAWLDGIGRSASGTPSDLAKIPAPLGDLRRRVRALDYLTQCREVRKRYGGLMDLVAAGRSKQVRYPKPIGPETIFPELSGFRRLMRIAVGVAYAEAADGRSPQGTRAMVSALGLAEDVGGLNLIFLLVDNSMVVSFARWFQENMARLSLAELEMLDRELAQITARGPNDLAAVAGESASASDLITAAVREPELWRMLAPEAGLESVGRWNARQKEAFVVAARAELTRRSQKFLAMLRTPESVWFQTDAPALPAKAPDDPQGLAIYFADAVSPVETANLVPSIAIGRTIRRLLALHVKVQIFRWKNHRLPAQLSEAAPGMTQDPLSAKPFVYVSRGESYELYSEGGLGLGKIDLTTDGRAPASRREVEP